MTLDYIKKNMVEGSVEFYEACYRIMKFDKAEELKINRACQRLIDSNMWALYREVERLREIPAEMIAMIHLMECNNHPLGTLHNGERIIGTRAKTKLVPRGRGPFKTWIAGALDAIDTQNMWKVPEWSVGYMLRQCERFNGTGYINGAGKAEISPYIWSCSSINDGLGKYQRDGKFNPKAAANGQVGIATMLKALEIEGIFKPKYTTANPIS